MWKAQGHVNRYWRDVKLSAKFQVVRLDLNDPGDVSNTEYPRVVRSDNNDSGDVSINIGATQ